MTRVCRGGGAGGCPTFQGEGPGQGLPHPRCQLPPPCPPWGSRLCRPGTLSTGISEPAPLGQGWGAWRGRGWLGGWPSPGADTWRSVPVRSGCSEELGRINIDGPELLVEASPLTATGEGRGAWTMGSPSRLWGPWGHPASPLGGSPEERYRTGVGAADPPSPDLTHQTGPWHSSWPWCRTGPGCRCREGTGQGGARRHLPGRRCL